MAAAVSAQTPPASTTMSSKLTGPAEVQVSVGWGVSAPDKLPSLAVHSYMNVESGSSATTDK